MAFGAAVGAFLAERVDARVDAFGVVAAFVRVFFLAGAYGRCGSSGVLAWVRTRCCPKRRSFRASGAERMQMPRRRDRFRPAPDEAASSPRRAPRKTHPRRRRAFAAFFLGALAFAAFGFFSAFGAAAGAGAAVAFDTKPPAPLPMVDD